MTYLECIKGLATKENVICMQGDILKIDDMEEGNVTLLGVSGYCSELLIDLSPKKVIEHFKTIHHEYTVKK